MEFKELSGLKNEAKQVRINRNIMEFKAFLMSSRLFLF